MVVSAGQRPRAFLGGFALLGLLKVRRLSMPRSLAVSLICSIVFAAVWSSSAALAADLRRPFDTSVAFNYGFDNNYGSSGCTDYNCGSHCYDGHTGTDFPLVVGTTVRAAESGTVVATNNGCNNYGYAGNTCGGRCGNHVKIRHADGTKTSYCHMKKNSLQVSNGASVTCGQALGQTASSGSSTGPHLHLGWKPGGSFVDVSRGACTNSSGAWRQQNGYRDPVGTSCGCTPSTEVCDGTDNDCDGTVDGGDVCEVDLLIQAASSYAAPRTTDVNGDGLQDACGRSDTGWGCRLATGDGWGEKIETDKMRDDNGWGSPHYYATIRTGDVDGDGLADVCARHSKNGYQCWRSTGSDFEHYANADGYTNDDGWTDPSYYTTFRLLDVDGDGRDDVCARGPDGFDCRLSTGTGFGAAIEGPNWTDDSGFNRAMYYGTIRTGDLDADGRDDVCIRVAAGFRCYLSNGQGFDTFETMADFSNDGGWDDMTYWSTLRLADYDGDGRDDVCARYYSGWKCLKSTDSGFGAREDVRSLPVTGGWDDPTNYATIRVGDVNGDGADDFCARANAGMRCFGLDAGQTFNLDGPRWADDLGWDNPEHYQNIFMADIGGDRRADLCGRGVQGLSCRLSTDDGFVPIDGLDDFTNDQGWNQMKYYSTLRLGSGECRPERCNGFDDDCDGEVDEDVCTSDSDAGSGGDVGSGEDAGSSDDAGSGGDPGSDSGSVGGDIGFADTGSGDAADLGLADGSVTGARSTSTSASCAVRGGGSAPTPLGLLLGLPLVLFWRKRLWRRGRLLAALLMGCLLINGCDAPTESDAPATNEQASDERESELRSFEPVDTDKRLLGVHADWQLRGQIQPAPPRSDAAPRFASELLYKGEPQAWPLEDEFVTNAVFVPASESRTSPAALALRMSDGRLVLVDLDTGTVTDLDDNLGFSVAAAADGCCLAYMKGDMGFQSTLRVINLQDGQHRDVPIDQNGWSPAISPSGDKVAYVATSPAGQPALYVHDFDSAETNILDTADKSAFPAGPQPPFWTERGLAFAAERGAYLIAPTGGLLASSPAARGLLVDMSTGQFFDGAGQPLSLESR
jgi:hypothetical protein